jgi:spore coat protein U-like protein
MKSTTRFSKRSVKHVTTPGLGLLALGMIAAGPALAQTVTAPLAVTATVTDSCVISTTPVAFGTYDATVTNLTTPLYAQGAVIFTCTLGSALDVRLTQGANPAVASTPAIPQRQMISGANLLPYFLYSNTERTTVWGDTVATAVLSTGTGASQSLPVFGQIPAGQNRPDGGYTDTVTATLVF